MSSTSVDRLLSIMQRLRDPADGCEWDRAQNFRSIAPYTIEEAYEVADAIERDNMDDLREELGDLLLQVVFHSQMAAENGAFDFCSVAAGIADKMEARHPHIFGGQDGSMDSVRWEALKERERSNKGATSAMDGVATALPALLRAEKLQKRAARTGFDWSDTDGPKSKVLEELVELEDATDETKAEEAGDLLFAAVNLVRAYGQAPEDALRAANSKFEGRFRSMEKLSEGSFNSLDLDAQEQLWQEVKRREKLRSPRD